MKHVEKRVWITDDLGGKGDAETLRWSFDGTDYELDVNKQHRANFESAVKRFRDASREVTSDGPDAPRVRAWAAAKGVRVSSRGRIPADVYQAYMAERWPEEEAS